MRIIVDLRTLEEARKMEETIKTGYVDPIIENLVNWIAVEEDLADSYEEFSKSLASTEEREMASELHVLSTSDADALRKKLQEFEGFENEYQKRIRLIKKLTKKAKL